MSRDNDTLDIEYEVDRIIQMRVNPKNNKREFLVKWQSNKHMKRMRIQMDLLMRDNVV